MTFWAKSLRVFNGLWENGTQSVRRIAHKTGWSTSRVHRLTQAMERRGRPPESWWWETEEGRRWLTRLVGATLDTFGLKRGVGMDTLREFFARRRLETPRGCSPSALRGVMEALVDTIVETTQGWEQDGVAGGEVREIIGAVDETFLEQLILVFQDVPTGYIVQEVVADNRTYATWKALVDERLQALSTSVLYLVSDRAKALIQLAEQGFKCLSMPDFFHFMHDIVKNYSLALGRRMRQAHKALLEAQEALARLQGQPYAAQEAPAAQALVAMRQTEVTRWEEAHHTYRRHLETLSFTLHPFRMADAAPQTSAQVASHLLTTVAAIEVFAQGHQLPTRHAAVTKVRKQIPALAALVDFWWEGVRQDMAHADLSPLWRQWAEEVLLPLVYWEHQVAHTRCARRKAKIRQALETMQGAFRQHALTQCLPPQACKEWHVWATQRVKAFQRTSSAVEGRNGYLSQMHHNHRGLPKQRYKVWTALHNFDCHAADGTTPASRFFMRTFPDLFETVLSTIDDLPRPRKRNQAMALTG
jgi:hypothetical protein